MKEKEEVEMRKVLSTGKECGRLEGAVRIHNAVSRGVVRGVTCKACLELIVKRSGFVVVDCALSACD